MLGLGRPDVMALPRCVMRAVAWFAPQRLPLWQERMVSLDPAMFIGLNSKKKRGSRREESNSFLQGSCFCSALKGYCPWRLDR